MTVRAKTVNTINEAVAFLNTNGLAIGDVYLFSNNASGYIDIAYESDDVDGAYGYESATVAGSPATVSVPAGARVFVITAQDTAGAGGTITIDGGDPIPVAASGAFDINLDGRKRGAFNIVFSVGLTYYVDWIEPT